MRILGNVLAYEFNKVGKGHHGTGYDKVELVLDVLGTAPFCGDVGKAEGCAYLVAHAYLLADAVNKMELHIWEHDGQGDTRESAACAKVHDSGTRLEGNKLCYAQGVQYVVLVEVVYVLA